MRLMSLVRHAIRSADCFSSSEMLRFQGDLEYSTLTGGLLSMGILATVIIGFASMILDTLTLSTITAQQSILQAYTPTPLNLTASPQSMFMFGVSINSINLSAPVRYFDIFLELYEQSDTEVEERVELPLQQCTREHWNSFPDLLERFDALGVSNWLCPAVGAAFHLEGSYLGAAFSQYMVRVTACHNETDPDRPCAPQADIEAQSFHGKGFYYFNIYYSNPMINADQKDFISYYVEDRTYVMFGDSVGTESFLYFSDYTVTTDSSIWPYTSTQQTAGAIVEEPPNTCSFQTTKNGPFVLFNLVKSPRSIVYTRSVQKISSVFSFIGGLISAIYAGLFVLKKYSTFAYEFSIACELFRPEDTDAAGEASPARGKECAANNMNLLEFCRYWLYVVSVKVGRALSCPRMAYLQDSRQEILRQLDIKTMLKRLIFLEHCMTFLFEDFQLSGLQLQRPTSHRDVRQLREKCESVAHVVRPSDVSQLSEKAAGEATSRLSAFQPSILSPGSQQDSSLHSMRLDSEHEKQSSARAKLEKVPRKATSILVFDMVSNNEVQCEKDNKVMNAASPWPHSKKQGLLLRELVDNARLGDRMSRRILDSIATRKSNLKIEDLQLLQ